MTVRLIFTSPEPHVGPNRTERVEHWREARADSVNERLAQLDIDARIHHPRRDDQGFNLEP